MAFFVIGDYATNYATNYAANYAADRIVLFVITIYALEGRNHVNCPLRDNQ
jgi:hypothetical protein